MGMAGGAGLPPFGGGDLELAAEEALMSVGEQTRGRRGDAVSLRTLSTAEGFAGEIEDAGPPGDRAKGTAGKGGSRG